MTGKAIGIAIHDSPVNASPATPGQAAPPGGPELAIPLRASARTDRAAVASLLRSRKSTIAAVVKTTSCTSCPAGTCSASGTAGRTIPICTTAYATVRTRTPATPYAYLGALSRPRTLGPRIEAPFYAVQGNGGPGGPPFERSGVNMEEGKWKMEKSCSFGNVAASSTLFHLPFSLFHLY